MVDSILTIVQCLIGLHDGTRPVRLQIVKRMGIDRRSVVATVVGRAAALVAIATEFEWMIVADC